jgi:M6 family metalloprotease-like protein
MSLSDHIRSAGTKFCVSNLLVEEVSSLPPAGLDLKQFDSKNANIVDALNIMYAGQTQYRGELWPHNWHINLQFGTMRTDLYLLTSLGRTPADLSIGTFCHENGHLLCRFPDMYDYGERDGDSIKSAGIGSYCLMGSGNHNDNGRSPSPVCAYLRDLAGWCDNEVNLNAAGTQQAPQADYNTVMKYRTQNQRSSLSKTDPGWG